MRWLVAAVALLTGGCDTLAVRGRVAGGWLHNVGGAPDDGGEGIAELHLEYVAPREGRCTGGAAPVFGLGYGGRDFYWARATSGQLGYSWEIFPEVGAMGILRCGQLQVGLGALVSPISIGDYWGGGDVIGGFGVRVAVPVDVLLAVRPSLRVGLRFAYEHREMITWGRASANAVAVGVAIDFGTSPPGN